MENAYYYTLSTIAQTLAGAFGFLVAVVLYQLQILHAALREKATRMRTHREAGSTQWQNAIDSSQWDVIKNIIARTPITGIGPTHEERAPLESLAASFVNDVERLAKLSSRLRTSLALTGLTIAACFLFLPFGFFFAPVPWLCRLIFLAFVSAACWCLQTYYPIVYAVITD